MRLAISATGTGVGKTRVTLLLAAALRRLGRRVWLHKAVACGCWDGSSSEDGRALRAACGDGQDPATVCPLEFPEPASPHLAAAAAGMHLDLDHLRAGLAACQGDHDLLVEGAGGLLAPLTAAREGLAELCGDLPFLIVTRPDLGTLHSTCATVEAARSRGLRLLGLALNRPQPVEDSLAVRSAAGELEILCRLPILADLAHGATLLDAGPLLRLLSAGP